MAEFVDWRDSKGPCADASSLGSRSSKATRAYDGEIFKADRSFGAPEHALANISGYEIPSEESDR